jgi:hypothetical protein
VAERTPSGRRDEGTSVPCVATPSWRGRRALASRGHPGLAVRSTALRRVKSPNSMPLSDKKSREYAERIRLIRLSRPQGEEKRRFRGESLSLVSQRDP